MRISSVYKDKWIAIEYNGEFSYTVQVHIDIGHGRFDAINIAINWLNYNEFVSELNEFILDRSRTPHLKGTYNTYLVFSGHAHRIILDYQLGDAYNGEVRLENHYQRGTFEISQEYLLQILAEFSELEPSHSKIS
jgi:hypothetical protein